MSRRDTLHNHILRTKTKFLLERNGPIVAEIMREAATPDRFTVVACEYESRGGATRTWNHRTLKAAFRTLGSVCDYRGKLYQPGAYSAAIVTPEGRVMNWREVKAVLAVI